MKHYYCTGNAQHKGLVEVTEALSLALKKHVSTLLVPTVAPSTSTKRQKNYARLTHLLQLLQVEEMV